MISKKFRHGDIVEIQRNRGDEWEACSYRESSTMVGYHVVDLLNGAPDHVIDVPGLPTIKARIVCVPGDQIRRFR